MKKLIIGMACLLQAGIIAAQSPAAKFREVNDTVIAKYNKGDYKGIYVMANQTYKNLNSEGELTWNLEDKKKVFGQVLSTEMIADLGDIKFFKWICQRGNIKLELWLDGNSILQYKFNDFILQPNAPVRQPLTDNPLKTQLDSMVDKYARIYMNYPHADGLSLGIYHKGKKYTYNYGEMARGTGKPVTDQTIFTVGSITKTFTGVLLARAVVEKKLKPDDDIRKYLDGSFPNLEYQGHPITLLDLANHTSGISHFRFNAVPANFETMTPAQQLSYFDAYTLDSLYRDLHNVKLDTMPGTHYYYSLIGTTLLNIALQKVYHESIDRIVRDYYGHTFHMKDTKLATDPADMPRYAEGYNDKGELQPKMPHYTVSLSTIHSTTRDMMNYVAANVEEKDPAIRLSHQLTFGELSSFAVGYTWDMEQYYSKYKMIWHSGYDYGSISLATAYPELHLGMWIWANEDSNARQGAQYDLEREIRYNLLYLDSLPKK